MRFSTVVAFVETVGRRQQSTFGGLDTMTCFWTGPSAIQSQFSPIIEVPLGISPFIQGTPHPEFPGMFIKSVRQVFETAGISSFEIDYEGMFRFPGGNWISPPIVSRKTAVGTLSYTFGVQLNAQQVSQSGLNRTTENKVLRGSQSITMHYTTSAVKIAYRSRLIQLNPQFQGIANSLGVGYNIFKRVLSPFTGGSTYSSTTQTVNLEAFAKPTPYIYNVAAFIEAEQAAIQTSIQYGLTGGDNTEYFSINSPPGPDQTIECLDFSSDPEGVYYKNSETWQVVLSPPQQLQ
jgi:hypothetical protein